jgi:glycine cleavage system transcriptional repressor
VLFELGCNLEDSAMTRLAGEFAIMLIFSAPGRFTQRRLEQAFTRIAAFARLVIYLKPLRRSETIAIRRGNPFLISVYGADRPGIVYRVSDLLARRRINITDVSTHRTTPPKHKQAKPLYLMLLEAEVPSRLKASQLNAMLRKLAERLGVEVTLRSAEAPLL